MRIITISREFGSGGRELGMRLVLLLPMIWDIDGIWGSAAIAQGMAILCTVIFLAGMRKKYHYA